MTASKKSIELLAPAGNFSSLRAAIQAKADSVYFGIGILNMRANSNSNFSIDDIDKVKAICKEHNKKAYIAINTLMYDEDIETMKKICTLAKEKEIDGVIASDIAVLSYAKSINLPIHISTQLNVSNFEAVKFFSSFADVIVLARELGLQEIKNICLEIEKQQVKGPNNELIKIEIFVHGALCVAISGRCHMSLFQYNQSANRGACLQACRRRYKIIEEETNKELIIDNKYIMSPKDLCTINFIDQLIASGASIFKIEGRGRSAEYVYQATKAYREAIDCVADNSFTEDKIDGWINDLSKVYNRGFWHGGYYLNKSLDQWSKAHGSKARTKKIYVGKVKNYFSNKNIVEVLIEAGSLNINDEVLFIGNTSGVIYDKISSLWVNDKDSESAKKGDVITFITPNKVRKNDQLYILKQSHG